MLPADRLRDKLIVMNGKGVQAYRDLGGAYRFDRFELYLDSVYPDPAAPACEGRIRVDQAEAQVPRVLWESPAGRMATQDFLARAFREAAHRHVRTRWAGRVPPLAVDAGGQEVLARNCCLVEEDRVEVHVTFGLPAEGRKVQARPAQVLFFEELPAVVNAGLIWANLDPHAGQGHAETCQDYMALRETLPSLGLVAFLADGSLLAREAGPTDRPLRGGRAVALRAPDDLAVTISLPHRGPVRGLGIPRGVTVIAGPSYSGKSTLLSAIASGVYPHVPGDGRELVAAVPDAAVILAEVGRRVERVDVSGFIQTLPYRTGVTAAAVERATGALSVAAAVAEALEVGTRLLILDEDTCAIAILVRDHLIQQLTPDSTEPVTPLVDRVRALWENHGISSVIATGGLGAYLEVADTVIAMEGFQPTGATDRARALMAARTPGRAADARPFPLPLRRCPLSRGPGGVKGKGLRAELRGRATLGIGRDAIDLAALPLLVDASQARAAGDAILLAVEKDYIDGEASIGEILDRVFADVEASGLDALAAPSGSRRGYALPRRHEVAAILNRLRWLQVHVRRPQEPVSAVDRQASGSLDVSVEEAGAPEQP